MKNTKQQWRKRVEVFRYLYTVMMTGEKQSPLIKKSAFENYLFDNNQTKLIEYFADNQKELIKLISDNLAKDWTWERIPEVEKAILLEAVTESKALNIDREIIIDQALVTTKHFSIPSSTKYINAILDKIIK